MTASRAIRRLPVVDLAEISAYLNSAPQTTAEPKAEPTAEVTAEWIAGR